MALTKCFLDRRNYSEYSITCKRENRCHGGLGIEGGDYEYVKSLVGVSPSTPKAPPHTPSMLNTPIMWYSIQYTLLGVFKGWWRFNICGRGVACVGL